MTNVRTRAPQFGHRSKGREPPRYGDLYEGTTSWGNAQVEAKFKRFVLAPDRISFDLPFDGTKYSGTLIREPGGRYHGFFVAMGANHQATRVDARCFVELDPADDTCRLVGEWIENGVHYPWTAELEKVAP